MGTKIVKRSSDSKTSVSSAAITGADELIELKYNAPRDTLVFESDDLLTIFVPTDDIRRNYLQTWQNQFDRYRIYVSRNVTESYDDNGVRVEQDGFVISTSSGGSTASIVAYVGDETEVVFPSTVRLRGTDLTVVKIGREENNSPTVSNASPFLCNHHHRPSPEHFCLPRLNLYH